MDLDTYCISRHTFYLSLVFAEDSDLGETANYVDINDEVYTSDDTDDEESEEEDYE